MYSLCFVCYDIIQLTERTLNTPTNSTILLRMSNILNKERLLKIALY